MKSLVKILTRSYKIFMPDHARYLFQDLMEILKP